jgi:hypothetical protein
MLKLVHAVRRYIIYIICLIFLISCTSEERQVYKRITLSTYNKYKTKDTLYNTKEYVATKCDDTLNYFKSYVTLIKWSNGQLFLLDPDAYFENDSTIIYYSSPLKTDSEIGSFQKNGIWFYADFYIDKIDSVGIYQESVEGVKYNVDSVPPDAKQLKYPSAEGIYLYQDSQLKQISTIQSEEIFLELKKDGFYFLPLSGRFYKRYSVTSIK